MWNSNSILFGSKNVRLFAYARTALLCGLRLLGLGPNDLVLLPSYICDSALAPFNHLGLRVRFYPVREDLSLDMSDLEGRIDAETRALLVVNFFGFPQDYPTLKELCRDKEIFLIEDNAHGLLSRAGPDLLGTFGDIAVCSFRKHLIVPDGAALIINRPSLAEKACDVALSRKWHREFPAALKSGVKAWDHRLSLGIVKRLEAHGRASHCSGSHEQTAVSADTETAIAEFLQPCSFYARYVLRRLNVLAFQNRLRERYYAAIEHMTSQTGMVPVFSSLPDGVLPRAAPAISQDPRSAVCGLRERGLYASTWPRLPRVVRDAPEAFPSFYRRVVVIPLAGPELLLGTDPRRVACHEGRHRPGSPVAADPGGIRRP